MLRVVTRVVYLSLFAHDDGTTTTTTTEYHLGLVSFSLANDATVCVRFSIVFSTHVFCFVQPWAVADRQELLRSCLSACLSLGLLLVVDDVGLDCVGLLIRIQQQPKQAYY